MKIFEKVITYTVSAIFSILLLYLTVLSMFSTSALDFKEHTYFLTDYPLAHVLTIALLLFIAVFLRKKISNITISEKFLNRLFIGIISFSIFWILSTQFYPFADQNAVLTAAMQMRDHDFSSFLREGYGYLFPHQHGLMLFYYLLSFLIGSYNYVGAQLINVLALAIVFYCIRKISFLLFHSEIAAKITLFSYLIYLPLSFYVTFVYGNLIGLAFSMLAILFEFYFFKTFRWYYPLLSAFFICTAILIKSNYLVFFVGMALIALLHLFFSKQLRVLFLLACLILFYPLSHVALEKAMTGITGLPNAEGVPMSAYLAMGLQDSNRAPGWYNDFNRALYVKHGCDTDLTDKIAREDIKQSISRFQADPMYTFKFFTKKVASEWNDPSFQCFWIQDTRTSDIKVAPWIQTINKGNAYQPLSIYLNLLHTIILFFALAYILLNWKQLKFEQLLFAIIFIGGFLFHFLWEAKSQYTLSYFILLLPYAANGVLLVTDRLLELSAPPGTSVFKSKLFTNSVFIYGLIFILILLICGVTTQPLIASSIKIHGDDLAYQNYLHKITYKPVKNGTYYIEPLQKSGFALSLAKPQYENGAALEVQQNKALETQKIYIRNFETFQILHINYSQKVVSHFSDKVIQQPYARGFEAEQWKFHEIKNGGYYIYSTNGCVLAYDEETLQVRLEAFTGENNQIWDIKVCE